MSGIWTVISRIWTENMGDSQFLLSIFRTSTFDVRDMDSKKKMMSGIRTVMSGIWTVMSGIGVGPKIATKHDFTEKGGWVVYMEANVTGACGWGGRSNFSHFEHDVIHGSPLRN